MQSIDVSRISAQGSSTIAAVTSSAEQGCSQHISTSKRKLETEISVYDEFVNDDNNFQYNIIDLDSFAELLNTVCSCKFCNRSIRLFTKHVNGLTVNIHIECEQCGSNVFKPNSKKINYKVQNTEVSLYDVNI